MSTICTNQQIKCHGDLCRLFAGMPQGVILSRILGVISLSRVTLPFKPGGLLFEICASQLMIEMQGDVWQLL